MAFYDEEEEQDVTPEGPQATGASSGVVGAGMAPGGAADAAGGGAAAPKAEPFVGITQYLNANKPQSQKLAGQVAGKVDEKAAAVDSSLAETQNSFNQAADAQRVDADEGLFGEVKSNAAGVLGDEAKKTSFTKARDATYSGPQSLDSTQSWAGLQSMLQKAKGAKDATGTEEGRMGLIKEVSNNPRQSQGALTFDNLLLQSNPNSAEMLKKAGSSLGDIDARIGGAQTSAAAKAKEIADLNALTSQKAKGAVKEGFEGLRSDLTSREGAKDAEQKKYVEDFKKAISRGNLGSEQLKALGMSGDDLTYGIDTGNFLDYVDGADVNSVATNEDLARQQALQALAGGGVDLGGDVLSGASPIGQTGKGYNFRANDFVAARDKAGAAYKQTMETPNAVQNLGLPSIAGYFTGNSADAGPGVAATLEGLSLTELYNKLSQATGPNANPVMQKYFNEVVLPAYKRVEGQGRLTLNNPNLVGGVTGQLQGPVRMGV